MNKTDYETVYLTGQGTRMRQEDTAYVDVQTTEVFAVLCDGMGGIAGGNQASKTAVSVFREYYEEYRNDEQNRNWMQSAAAEADRRIFYLSDGRGNRIGAGSTLAAVLVTGNAMRWVAVGDSRVYVLRGNRIVRATNDHILRNVTRFGMPVSYDDGAGQHADGESLVSFLGIGGLPLLDMNEDAVILRTGDTVMLCSDGLYKNMPDSEMAEIIQTGATLHEAADRLEQRLREVNDPAQDNYTFILIRMK